MAIKDREARLESQRRWYRENAERHKANVRVRNKRYAAELRAEIAELKESTPCADCGQCYPACVMQFDHVRGDKRDNVSDLRKRGRRVTLAEIEKCEVVCANCHAIRTWQRRGSLAQG